MRFTTLPGAVMQLRRFSLPFIAFIVAVASILVGCGAREGESRPLTVFAAASMTDVLQEVAGAWKSDGGVEVRFSFDATSRLVRQVIEGAPADVLVSADDAWMDQLVAAGKAESSTRVTLARNELVFVVPVDSARPPASASELPGRLEKIALAGENVPAGKYAKSALEKANVWAAVAPRVVPAVDVRAALKWVSIDEVDGGIVYRTDAKADPKVKVAFEFASDSHPPIVYPAAVVTGSARRTDAERFLAFCRSAKALAVFAKHGFLPSSP